MLYSDLRQIVIDLPMDIMTKIYSDDFYTISLYRPSTLSRRFRDYDPSKNVQIFMQIGNDEPFRPNHFRVLVDLNLKVRENPQLKDELLYAFDNIFYGDDPFRCVQKLESYFSQGLNPLYITAQLAQLFLVEQDIGFGKESKYEPRSLYIMGWIRTFIDAEKELDLILSSICHNNPPSEGYTCQDNQKNNRYNPDAQPLWYKE